MPSNQLLNESELNAHSASAAVSAGVPAQERDAVSRRPHELVPKAVVERLAQRSDAIGLTYFMLHFALLGLGAWLTWLSLASYALPLVLALHAVVLGFLFSPLHECAHGTAFRSRWLNETALWIVAVVYIVPPNFFRYFHLGHHRYTQVPGKDPSLVLPDPATFKQYLWYCAGLWFWWRNITWILKHAVGIVDPASVAYVPKSRLRMMVLEARVMMTLYIITVAAAVHTGWVAELMLCWLIPRFLGEPLQRIIRVAEHVGCAESTDLLENTRTTLSHPLFNAIAWQMPYHAEHHLFPNVPFHALPALHPHVASSVVVEPRGYWAGQRDIIAWLRSSDGGAARSATRASVDVQPRV
jgi:fatty acid desaturase